jgi:AcrR family transcriptional regulator
VTVLNQSLDLRWSARFTIGVTTARTVRADRASSTQEAILKAAERLYAEHGMFAVSNRQVSEAAGQGNNAAVGYHFGTKADLVRAIEQKHRASIERLLEKMVAQTGDSSELRDWVACLVCSLTEHLAQLGNPTWYARFAAQALTDPAYHKIVIKDALASPSLVQVVEGITRCLPEGRRHRTQHHGAQSDDAHVCRLRTRIRRGCFRSPNQLGGRRIRRHRRHRRALAGTGHGAAVT